MPNVLFCMPLKKDHLKKYEDFVLDTEKNKAADWKEMLSRYDMSSVKIWTKQIGDTDYVFVYHDIGPTFAEKIQGWNDSTHPFDQWFGQQLTELLDGSPVDAVAKSLVELS